MNTDSRQLCRGGAAVCMQAQAAVQQLEANSSARHTCRPVRAPAASIRASGREPHVSSSTRSSSKGGGTATSLPAGAAAAAGAAGAGVGAVCPALAAAAAASACSAGVMSRPCWRLSRGPTYAKWDRQGSCSGGVATHCTHVKGDNQGGWGMQVSAHMLPACWHSWLPQPTTTSPAPPAATRLAAAAAGDVCCQRCRWWCCCWWLVLEGVCRRCAGCAGWRSCLATATAVMVCDECAGGVQVHM